MYLCVTCIIIIALKSQLISSNHPDILWAQMVLDPGCNLESLEVFSKYIPPGPYLALIESKS